MSRFENDDEDAPPTRLVRNKPKTGVSSPDSGADAEATRKVGFEPQGQMGGVNPGPQEPAAHPAINEEERTVVFRPPAGSFGQSGTAIRPVVGWLVVIAGPGSGSAVEFSYGHNKIGRDSDQNIRVDFGDTKISRRHHAALEFDPKDRKFYLSKGDNLVYLNGERVGTGSERELTAGDQITIGDTTLQFVAFCGTGFNWQED